MTILVKDEKDIIRENIEYHLSRGIDYFIVTDNDSHDGTTEILQEYKKLGLLDYMRESGPFNQSQWVTKMAHYAYSKYAADWVINNDADEFWWHDCGNIKLVLTPIPEEFSIVKAERHNMLLNPNRNANTFYKDMILRRKKSLNPIGKPLPAKVCSRGSDKLTVLEGSHAIYHPDWHKIYESDIEIFHYPFRSFEQLKNKVINAGSGYERNPPINKQTGCAIRKIYADYKNNPDSLKRFYESCFAKRNNPQNCSAIEENDLIVDVRLSQCLSNLMKS